MGKFIDITGQKFGRLTVVERLENDKHNRSVFRCKCDCGNEITAAGRNLRIRKVQSCGCYAKDKKKEVIHGLSKHPLYRIWLGIKQRCYNLNAKRFQDWGGRGITMCDEWRNDFQAFYDWAIANGYEKGLSIDRINNNDNYTPENCRFTTVVEQQRNMRRNNMIEYRGETKTLSEWCEILNLNYNNVKSRLRYGWSIERAFET